MPSYKAACPSQLPLFNQPGTNGSILYQPALIRQTYTRLDHDFFVKLSKPLRQELAVALHVYSLGRT